MRGKRDPADRPDVATVLARFQEIQKFRINAKKRQAEKEKKCQAEIAQQKAEEEKQRQAEIAQRKAEEEKQRQAQITQQKAEEEKQRQAEIAQRKAQEEKKRQAEMARQKAEEEKQRQAEIEMARQKAEEEKRRQNDNKPSFLKKVAAHLKLTNRYTDNGNGTVTDNRTGLSWLKNALVPTRRRGNPVRTHQRPVFSGSHAPAWEPSRDAPASGFTN